MQTVLIAVHLMIVVALVGVVLLQRSEGGALGMGGGGGFMTGRGQANVLTRATAILAALFFMTSLGLTVLARYTHTGRLNFNAVQRPGAAEPAPKLPPTQSNSVLDQVRQIEQQRSKAPAPGAPAPAEAPAPAPSTASQTPSASRPAASTPPASPAPTTPPATGLSPTEPSGMPNTPAPSSK